MKERECSLQWFFSKNPRAACLAGLFFAHSWLCKIKNLKKKTYIKSPVMISEIFISNRFISLSAIWTGWFIDFSVWFLGRTAIFKCSVAYFLLRSLRQIHLKILLCYILLELQSNWYMERYMDSYKIMACRRAQSTLKSIEIGRTFFSQFAWNLRGGCGSVVNELLCKIRCQIWSWWGTG